jgi:hypothetical protein
MEAAADELGVIGLTADVSQTTRDERIAVEVELPGDGDACAAATMLADASSAGSPTDRLNPDNSPTRSEFPSETSRTCAASVHMAEHQAQRGGRRVPKFTAIAPEHPTTAPPPAGGADAADRWAF